jgi:hypothetical protein
MRLTRKAVFAGLASFALAGTAFAAESAPRFNTMHVGLPDGSVAHIRYSGDVAPRVFIAPARARAARGFAPAWGLRAFDPAPFAMLDRIAMEMNRRAAEMMRAMAMAPPIAADAAPRLVAGTSLPAAGFVGYSIVSQVTGDGRCTRRWVMTREAPDRKPKMFTEASGHCPDTGAAGIGADVQPVADRSPAPLPLSAGRTGGQGIAFGRVHHAGLRAGAALRPCRPPAAAPARTAREAGGRLRVRRDGPRPGRTARP